MSIQPKTPGVHHIGLRSTNFDLTKKFYGDLLGFQLVLDSPDLLVFLMGAVLVAFKKTNPKTPDGNVFTPFNAGLDHIALTCESEEELQRVAAALAAANVENTGVKQDPALKKNYVAFKDPDRIQWEFYMK